MWNAPPARVYLGDAGSYLIGTALAMLFLAAARYEAAVVSGAFLFVGVPGRRHGRRDRAAGPGRYGRSCAAIAATCTTSSSTGAGRRRRRRPSARPRRLVLTGIGIGVSGLTGGAAIAVAATVVVVVGAAAILTFTAPGAWTPDH